MASPFNNQIWNISKTQEIELEEIDQELSLEAAIEYINKDLNAKLLGLNPANSQLSIDKLLHEFFTEMQPKDIPLSLRKSTDTAVNEDMNDVDLERERRGSKINRSALKKSTKAKGKSDIVLPPDILAKRWALGTPAISALSMAICITGATLKNIPLYEHIWHLTIPPDEMMADFKYQLPIPMVTIINCGKVSLGKLNAFKEVMLLPGPHVLIKDFIHQLIAIRKYLFRAVTTNYPKWTSYLYAVNQVGAISLPFDKPEMTLDFLLQVAEHAGYIAGKDFLLAINCASHEILDRERAVYDYVSGSAFKTMDETVDFWVSLTKAYPSICAIIDPFRKQEGTLWQRLCKTLSEQCLIIGDFNADWPYQFKELKDSGVKDLETTDVFEASSQETKPQDNYVATGQILQIQMDTTITDVIEYVKDYKASGYHVVIAANQREADSWIKADLAIGLQATFLKTGGLSRKERTDILNRLYTIEQKLMNEDKLLKPSELWKFPKLFSELSLTV